MEIDEENAASTVTSTNDNGSGTYAELLVNLVLDGKTVAVPAEATLNVVTCLLSITRHNVLHRVARQTARMTNE